ncbi:ParB N-terminal domain-containing protein [Burkholderia gladioli]|uniref:ParB N-terminal domain-containing protein n=1 Tax=Burkholderia gladioli TaxID=28095 RepID=UPI00163F5229|nr:ParB N-terminal domain-containing protein [Burkholderia gladioli]
MIELDLHPLCALFPRLDGVEFDALKADIAANGQRTPIVIHDGQILDGGNRYRACIELDREPIMIQFDGADPLAYVLSLNLHRRHLSPGQQATIVAAATDWLAAYSHGGDRKSDQAATLPLDTVAARAAQSGASERTQRMADKVARTDPALAKRVAHGEVSLPAAARQVSAAAGGPRPEPAAESAAEVLERTAAVAVKPPFREQDSDQPQPQGAEPAPHPAAAELESLRDTVQELAHELEQATDELSAYRAAESGEGEKKLLEQQKEIARLKTEVRRLTDRRDSLMNENAELKREVKSLSRKLGRPTRG